MEHPWWLENARRQRLIRDPGYLQIWSMVQHQQGNRSMAIPRETHHEKTPEVLAAALKIGTVWHRAKTTLGVPGFWVMFGVNSLRHKN